MKLLKRLYRFYNDCKSGSYIKITNCGGTHYKVHVYKNGKMVFNPYQPMLKCHMKLHIEGIKTVYNIERIKLVDYR